MARRTVPFDELLAEDRVGRHYEDNIATNASLWHDEPDRTGPDPRDYVSYLVDGSPFECLLWREIRIIEKRSRMTDWQKAAFESHLRGLTIRETAELYQRSASTIQQHLDVAFIKARSVPHRGVLTVMIEELGWPAVREALADKLEARVSRQR